MLLQLWDLAVHDKIVQSTGLPVKFHKGWCLSSVGGVPKQMSSVSVRFDEIHAKESMLTGCVGGSFVGKFMNV